MKHTTGPETVQELARASAARDHADKALQEQCSALADRLHYYLDRGDVVSLGDGSRLEKRRVWYPVAQADRSCDHMRPVEALLLTTRTGATYRVDSGGREPYWDGNNMHYPTSERYSLTQDGEWDIVPAGPKVRAAFARRAGEILQAAAGMLRAQAREREEAAAIAASALEEEEA